MKKLVFSVLLVIFTVTAFAQQSGTVTGKIVDSKTQKPLQSAIVSVQNTNIMKLTNAQGIFLLENVSEGENLLQIKSDGYGSLLLNIELSENQNLDLGVIILQEDVTTELQLSLITLTESDLGDDNSGSENTAGLLQASRDVFQQAAAFNWGQARYRIRGLDNEYGTTMINGIVMNKIYDGRPQWSNWGGLNDATRNQEFTMGSAASDYTFGGTLGTQEINTRASIYRPGNRVTMSGTNTNYSWRLMGTHASGMNKAGWAYVISASRRWAQEGYFDGTDYSANSLFASLEKKINENHSLNLTTIFAQNSRGKSSPNSQEVNDLMGVKYNSYWGWQDGKKRNSRDKDMQEPISILSHYWTLNEKTKINTNISYQTGSIGNTRIDNQGSNNPDPTYYRNLPSYFLNNHTTAGVWAPNYAQADLAQSFFLNNSQIDWNSMYDANQNSANSGKSVYALYEDRTDDNQFSFNSIVNSQLSSNILLNAGVSYRKLKSHNFQNMLDLLGGQYFADIDPFYFGNASQSDLNNPNRQIVEGDTYGYNYNLLSSNLDVFSQFKFTYSKFDFYVAQSFSRSESQREGLYKNGIYETNSYGKSQNVIFENFGFKGGLTYKLTGRHLFDVNALYMSKAPNLRNTFANARINNNITPNLISEDIMSLDASYIIRAPKLKARLTGFMSKIKGATELSFFYAESISDADGDEDSFVSEILTGINKKNIGVELGLEYNLTSTVKATAAASYGEYIYDNNPNVRINDDAQASLTNSFPITNFGNANLKNYRLPGMPQQAYSVGLEYRDPRFWWISGNVNYLASSFIDISNVLRTNNFTINRATGVNYSGATEETVRTLLKQEEFDAISLVNLVGGKSWRISNKNRNTFGFFASINNVFDVTYKTGGFEQSRKSTFVDLQQDHASGIRSFGPKYFYGYGRTFFLNFYINL